MPASADDPQTAQKPTFWIIPHTHWEGAVFKTREEYLEMGLPNILKAMALEGATTGLPLHARPGSVRAAVSERYPCRKRPTSAGSSKKAGCNWLGRST